MAGSDAMTKVRRAESACWAAASSVRDPDDIPASEAVRLYETLDRASRAISAAKTLLAKRVAASKQWERKGHGSAAEHLAQISGKSLGAARSELETSDALGGLSATKEALLGGQVSEAQGQIIANAARTNPHAERGLIKKAKRTNHQQLRDEAQKAKAAGDPSPAATHRRIHRDRRLSRHTDHEGAWNLHARGTVADGSIITAEIDRLSDEIFRANGKAGTHECRDAYAFDALTEMARRSGSLRHGTPTDRRTKKGLGAPQHLALLRLDVSALWRGYVEGDELCEVAGLGPIPVEIARGLLGDAVLKLVITKGVDVASITSLTRGPTQAMHYAKLWTSPTCVVEGCSRTIVEYDHEWGAEYKDTRHTRLDEIERKCHTHHDLHTLHGWALVPGKGERPMVAPDDPRHPAHAPPRAPTSGAPPPSEEPDLFSAAAV
jgi:uncharacterized protein DUF222